MIGRTSQNPDDLAHGIVLVELIGYMEETHVADKAIVTVIMLNYLIQMYTDHLKGL